MLASGEAFIASSKPSERPIATEEPTVPSSTAILYTLPPSRGVLFCAFIYWSIHSKAFLPSAFESVPILATYKSSLTFASRSTITTGIPASFASCKTVSQPVSTIGVNAIKSTPCAMKERIAFI